MLYSDKTIRQNGRYQFEPMDIEPNAKLNEVTKRLFAERSAGVHPMVVCTGCPHEVLSEEDFCIQLSDGENKAVILNQGSSVPAGIVGCAHMGSFDGLGEALNAVLERIGQAVGCEYINENAKSAISVYHSSEKLEMSLGVTWNEELAKKASEMLRKDEMIKDIQRVPNICVLLILPEYFFDIFLREDCYF